MRLKPDLLKGVYAYGFEKPSAIQQRAIRPIVRGRDVIAQSQSGTGKTAVFSIASLQLLDETSRDVQVLVLSPTRELAEQSQRVMQSLGDFMNVRCVHSSRECCRTSDEVVDECNDDVAVPVVTDETRVSKTTPPVSPFPHLDLFSLFGVVKCTYPSIPYTPDVGELSRVYWWQVSR